MEGERNQKRTVTRQSQLSFLLLSADQITIPPTTVVRRVKPATILKIFTLGESTCGTLSSMLGSIQCCVGADPSITGPCSGTGLSVADSWGATDVDPSVVESCTGAGPTVCDKWDGGADPSDSGEPCKNPDSSKGKE